MTDATGENLLVHSRAIERQEKTINALRATRMGNYCRVMAFSQLGQRPQNEQAKRELREIDGRIEQANADLAAMKATYAKEIADTLAETAQSRATKTAMSGRPEHRSGLCAVYAASRPGPWSPDNP
jgi:hypothetical protein